MEVRKFILINPLVRANAVRAVREAPEGHIVRISEATRTLEQNAKQWPYLLGFSEQLKWPVNGALVTLEPEEWKDLLTAAFHGDTVRLAQGLNGGVVMLGLRTSQFGIKAFAEWMQFLKAEAAQRSVEPVYAKAGYFR